MFPLGERPMVDQLLFVRARHGLGEGFKAGPCLAAHAGAQRRGRSRRPGSARAPRSFPPQTRAEVDDDLRRASGKDGR